MVKYPQVKVELVGEDGNAFAILGRVTKAMRREHIPQAEIDMFREEATSGDYSHLLVTAVEWVTTDNDDEDLEDIEDWDGLPDDDDDEDGDGHSDQDDDEEFEIVSRPDRQDPEYA